MDFDPTFPETNVARTGDFTSSVLSGTRLNPGFPDLRNGLCRRDPGFAGYCLDAPAFIASGWTYSRGGFVQFGVLSRES